MQSSKSTLFFSFLISDWKAPLLYITLQGAIALPIGLNCLKIDVPAWVIFIFLMSTFAAVFCYIMLAFCNPGYIMGSGQDVERRAGAYNPKDY